MTAPILGTTHPHLKKATESTLWITCQNIDPTKDKVKIESGPFTWEGSIVYFNPRNSRAKVELAQPTGFDTEEHSVDRTLNTGDVITVTITITNENNESDTTLLDIVLD